MELIEYRRRIILNGPHIKKSEGDILTFNTDIVKPLKACKVNFDPIQSGAGDPSPTNIRPIIGWTGVNLNATGRNIFDVNQANFVQGKYINDKGQVKSNNSYKYNTEYIKVKPNTTYTVRIKKASDQAAGFTVPLYDANKGFIERVLPIRSTDSGITLTGTMITTADTQYLRFSCGDRFIDTEIQIEEGSTVHDYEPFGTLYDVAFPDGDTVYGGTLDLLTGVLTVTHKFIDLTNQTGWTKSTSYPGGFYCNIYRNSLGIKERTDFICSHAKTAHILSQYVFGTCYCDGSVNIRIMQSGSELSDWETYRAEQSQNGTPICICAELATPRTFQLAPQQITTLKGINNIWADTGETRIAYWTH